MSESIGRRASDVYMEDLMKIMNGHRDLPFVTDEYMRITFCGDQSSKILGSHPRDVVGKELLSLLDQSSAESVSSLLAQLKKHGGSASIPVRLLIDQNCYIIREMFISTSFEKGPARFFGTIKAEPCSLSQPIFSACEKLRKKVEENISTLISDSNKEFVLEIFRDIRDLCECSQVDFFEYVPDMEEFRYIAGTGHIERLPLRMSEMSPLCIQCLDEGITMFDACTRSFGLKDKNSCVVVPAVESGITWGILLLISRDRSKMWDKLWIDTVVSIFRMIQSLLYARRVFKLLLLDKTTLISATKGMEEWIRRSTKEREDLKEAMLEKKSEQSEGGSGEDVTKIMGGLEETLREKLEVEKLQLDIDRTKALEIQKTRKELERGNTFLLHLSSSIENIDNTLRFSIGPGIQLLVNYQEAVTDLLRLISECIIHKDVDKDKLSSLVDRLENMGTHVTINTGTNVTSGRDTTISAGGDANLVSMKESREPVRRVDERLSAPSPFEDDEIYTRT